MQIQDSAVCAVPKVTENPPVELVTYTVEAALPGDATHAGAFVKDVPKLIEQEVAELNVTLPWVSLDPATRPNPEHEFAVGDALCAVIPRCAL
jgi:hypothetical protein